MDVLGRRASTSRRDGPAATPVAAASGVETPQPHLRLVRYFEFCDYYRVKPLSEAVLAFRFPVQSLRVRLPADAGPTALLPVFELLCYDNHITALDLQGARLGDAGAFALAAVVTANATLLELNVSYNDITDAGATVLCRALERSHLQRLSLRGNRIGVGGAAALSRVIRRTRHLAYIDVSNCALRVRGVHALTDALIQRAQARVARRLLHEAGVAAAAEWGGVAAAELGVATPHVALPPAAIAAAAAAGSTRKAAGFGWLWGDPQHLLVTHGSTVKTDWGSLSAALSASLRRAARGGGVGGGDFSPARPALGQPNSRRRRDSHAVSGASGGAAGDAALLRSDPRRPSRAAATAATPATPAATGGAAEAAAAALAAAATVPGGTGSPTSVGAGAAAGHWRLAGPSSGNRHGATGSDFSVGHASVGDHHHHDVTDGIASELTAHGADDLRARHGTGAGAALADRDAGTGRAAAAAPTGDAHTAAAAAAAPAVGSPSAPVPSFVDDSEDKLDIEIKVSGNFAAEEVFNSIVHGAGLLLSVLGAWPLLARAEPLPPALETAGLVGRCLYLVGLVAFFLSSTLSHSLFLTDASQVLRLIDHGAVFVLIAGTYSPFLLVNLAASPLGLALLAVVWAVAAVGVVMTACRGCSGGAAAAADGGRRLPLRLLLYTLQGWVGALAFGLVRACLEPRGWWSLFGGGIVYSLGLLLYSRDRSTHQLHSWYVLVVVSAAVHWAAVFLYVKAPSNECIAEAASRGLAWGSYLTPLPSAAGSEL